MGGTGWCAHDQVQFRNMDMLMEYINANEDKFGIHMRYATVGQYFDAVKATNTDWPMYEGDFFPYAFAPDGAFARCAVEVPRPLLPPHTRSHTRMCPHTRWHLGHRHAGTRFDEPGWASADSYWAGFYTSRPQLKGWARNYDGLLHGTELACVTGVGCVWAPPVSHALDRARRATPRHASQVRRGCQLWRGQSRCRRPASRTRQHRRLGLANGA